MDCTGRSSRVLSDAAVPPDAAEVDTETGNETTRDGYHYDEHDADDDDDCHGLEHDDYDYHEGW